MDPSGSMRATLEAIQIGMRLSIGVTRYYDAIVGRELWLMNARSAEGDQSWTAKAEDPFEAACALAELVGFDLRDG